MNSQPGEATRPARNRLSLSRQRSSASHNTDDDSDTSRCPSPLLNVQGGYRIDPFVKYPVPTASRGVKFMADYYIQVWAPQQSQAFSVRNGRNALLALVLPFAFQSSMLFEATIAMTRAAWVLRRGSDPFVDKMLLRHRGQALQELRNSLTRPDPPSSSLVLLTMSTLLTLNYMINDLESFEIHLRALESILQGSLSQTSDDIQNFVRGRVRAFGVLASFLNGQQQTYAARINEPGHRISSLTYPGHPYPPDLCAVIAKLPEGFAEVALSRSVAIEFISFLVKLCELIRWVSLSDTDQRATTRPGMTLQRAIYDLQCMSTLSLTLIEAQIVRALMAFCLHVYNQMTFRIPLARPLRPILASFNEQADVPRHHWLHRCLLWCAIVVASSWDTQLDASPEHHVVLDRLMERVPESLAWPETEATMRLFLWHNGLADEWEVCWRAALFRKRRERRGASQIVVMPRLLVESSQNSDTPSSDGRQQGWVESVKSVDSN